MRATIVAHEDSTEVTVILDDRVPQTAEMLRALLMVVVYDLAQDTPYLSHVTDLLHDMEAAAVVVVEQDQFPDWLMPGVDEGPPF